MFTPGDINLNEIQLHFLIRRLQFVHNLKPRKKQEYPFTEVVFLDGNSALN